ncbi:homeobox protein zampogna-like [Copidosoma floridanum]|uniref:homeobox protein zampogna-like n=1 Tax=Copidosoma floridanum TaxID=29053 RepID=UPI000C6F769D|nr:homeobox protein zampogna-like [Copidosoma floridanum]
MEMRYLEQLNDVAEEHNPQDQKLKDECAKKRNRTIFTTPQIISLERIFETTKYLSRSHRFLVAQQLKLTELQVQIWFQNRRMKFKKDNESGPDGKNSTSLPSTATTGQLGAVSVPESLRGELPLHGPQKPLPPFYHQQTLVPRQPVLHKPIPRRPMFFSRVQRNPLPHPYLLATQQLGVLERMLHLTSSGALAPSTRVSVLYDNLAAYDYARFQLNVLEREQLMHLQQLRQQLYSPVQLMQQPQQHQQLHIKSEHP